ncbi:flagellar biosynthetic protein FliR [Blastochloris viridis]|uniref:Flagellar biosynthetic protein FliR n=1 Tax=Blastochloris viridis TaxID=1079 RepID=A0A0H5BCA5_BLAVI|nr:flagellar biosynthetic protein FliR [Blastochloris viridis]ALK08801.1 flagellar biosynthesis protein FliR [Blastochloris viridis]BAR97901.1 flagellar biosynthesis protein FliR [Blastochloris viridis]CUU41462.1 flagellar biosynthesis protein FliR [Blastochloris viridis]
MTINVSFLPVAATVFLLMFARMGTLVMLMPGFGERNVPVRVRLTIALLLTLVMFPLHRNAYQVDMSSFAPLLVLLFGEFAVGFVMGLAARIALTVAQTAGTVIAAQLGLGFVTTVDPTQDQQGALLGSFLSLLGVTLVFATDLHHVAIAALANSYNAFAPGLIPSTSDALQLSVKIVSDAFRIGVQLSAPYLLFGMVFNVGLGLLARLMPQMQVYFLAMPLSIFAGFVILLALLGAMMGVYLDFIGGVLGMLAGR